MEAMDEDYAEGLFDADLTSIGDVDNVTDPVFGEFSQMEAIPDIDIILFDQPVETAARLIADRTKNIVIRGFSEAWVNGELYRNVKRDFNLEGDTPIEVAEQFVSHHHQLTKYAPGPINVPTAVWRAACIFEENLYPERVRQYILGWASQGTYLKAKELFGLQGTTPDEVAIQLVQYMGENSEATWSEASQIFAL